MTDEDRARWERVADTADPSWYLDPLVALQKRKAWIELARRAIPAGCGRLLKTDLFEEAFGEDETSSALLPLCRRLVAFDLSVSTVFAASRRFPSILCFVGDVRQLPLRRASVDAVLSLSTLDHFESRNQFVAALRESASVLAPGGHLGLILDNPSNPLYRPLRAMSRARRAPFPLGYTSSIRGTSALLGQWGMTVQASGYFIHNPRGVSTAIFLVWRRAFRSRAGLGIRAMLALFSVLGYLPTRRWTGCFIWLTATVPHGKTGADRSNGAPM